MSTLRDIYRPPGESASDGSPAIGLLRQNAGVFAGSLVIGALLWGVVEGLRAALALNVFGAESWTAAVVAIGAMRLEGAGVSASAAAVTIVVGSHRRAIAGSQSPRTRDFWPIVAAISVLSPFAGCLITFAAMEVATLGFGVGLHASWSSILHLLYPGDPLVGVGLGGVLALILIGFAHAMKARLARPEGRAVRVVVAVLLTQGVTVAVNAGVSSMEPEGPDSYLRRAAGRFVD